MKAIAHIYAKQDGTFDIAAVPMRPQDLAQVLLALASAVLKTLDAPSNITITDAGDDKPPTLTITGGEIGPGDRVEGIDGADTTPTE